MSTQNIGIYEDLTKIIFQSSSIMYLISSDTCEDFQSTLKKKYMGMFQNTLVTKSFNIIYCCKRVEGIVRELLLQFMYPLFWLEYHKLDVHN